MNFILGTWPWYIGGPLLALIMLLLLWTGKSFGFSSNFRTLCSAFGAGKNCSFFDFNWKDQIWNLLFLAGTIIGGFLGAHYFSIDQVPPISDKTVAELQALGFYSAGNSYSPTELFNNYTFSNILLLLTGGLLIGFGTRYAGGCTSGHAISGLSNLQWPSLIAVLGFFIGGLLMVHILFPLIF